ncbi:hypothetical protein TH53_26075 [Pedobacter lusitanus]|uniref:Uncharacterized protein n=1 Tax=Pedobacter lusitanus TaxID=1503925 RepID=A0A0D0GB61_9SPHI|nr:hypothetical protein [Pedobacter lusitanus]KIO74507.1 hypothetical protein TH53_26075 [Pedobacter lusitanus]
MESNNDLFLDIVEFKAKSEFVSDELNAIMVEPTEGMPAEFMKNLLKCRILEQQLIELTRLLDKHNR